MKCHAKKLTLFNTRPNLRIWIFGLILVFLSGCGSADWKTEETQNLRIYYKPDSYAEKNLAQVRIDYENSIAVAEQFLPRIKKEPKVKVFLYDKLPAKGYAKAPLREVHYRYSQEFRLTSVHEFLHIFLYELNPSAPLRFEEGICRIREGKRKKYKGQSYEISYYQLVKFTAPERWSVHEVFQDDYQDDDQGNIAAAFGLFALNTLGEQKFWSFYQELTVANWQELLAKYFGKTLTVIDQEFKIFVQSIETPPEAFKVKYSPETAHLFQ